MLIVSSIAFALLLTQATPAGALPTTSQKARNMAEPHATSVVDADADIRAIITDQAAAWNRHDAAGWASRFTPTADFINILGTPFSGKPAIEGITTRIFATIFKESHDSVTVQKIVFVTPTVAIAHYEHAVSGYTALPPGIQASDFGADGKGVLRTRMVYVLEKGADAKWMIVNGQNTAILPALKAP